MHGFDHAADPVNMLLAWPPNHFITGHQAVDGAAQVTAVQAAVCGLDVGMHTETADDYPFLGIAEQGIIPFRILVFLLQPALLVGIDSALLAEG